MIVIFGALLLMLFVFIESTVVFSRFIVIPVAWFKSSKGFKIFVAGSWFLRMKIKSSALEKFLFLLFYLGCECPLLSCCC